jgi:hypothetical protein
MSRSKVITKVLPKLQNFTLESVCKYQKEKEKTLIENLFFYPNFGKGFKVFLRIRPFEHWIVDNVKVKNNRHGKIFGINYLDGVETKKITKIRRTLQEGRWAHEYPEGLCYSDNGVPYDIKKIENLMDEKRKLIDFRNRELGILPQYIKEHRQKRQAKLEAAAKKKK